MTTKTKELPTVEALAIMYEKGKEAGKREGYADGLRDGALGLPDKKALKRKGD